MSYQKMRLARPGSLRPSSFRSRQHVLYHSLDWNRMSKRQTIRGEGDNAEKRFLQLVDGSKKSTIQKRGDVIVVVDGAESYVEVKECHAGLDKSGSATINQVRAIKYIPCVIWAAARDRWYVLSPDSLVRLAAEKNRGQHTEIPFESMNFSLDSVDDGFHVIASDATLKAEVEDAVRRGRKASHLQELMSDLQSELVALKSRFIELVKASS